MKALFYSTVFFAIISAGCADSSVKQNKTTHMDSSKKDNLVYSNTDSGKVNISNDEWKKILPADVYFSRISIGVNQVIFFTAVQIGRAHV